MIDLARRKLADKRLFAEPRYRDRAPAESGRSSGPRRKAEWATRCIYRREEWLLSIAEQIELRRLRITGLCVAAAAERLELPEPAVRAFYRFVDLQFSADRIDERLWFGEVLAEPGQRIRCPNRGCSAPQTWWIPDPATGQPLPCRACRLREYLRMTAKMKPTEPCSLSPEP